MLSLSDTCWDGLRESKGKGGKITKRKKKMAKCLHLQTYGGCFSDNSREVGGYKCQSKAQDQV